MQKSLACIEVVAKDDALGLAITAPLDDGSIQVQRSETGIQICRLCFDNKTGEWVFDVEGSVQIDFSNPGKFDDERKAAIALAEQAFPVGPLLRIQSIQNDTSN